MIAFDERLVYSAANADKLVPGDRVIVANTLKELKDRVNIDDPAIIDVIETIGSEDEVERFWIEDGGLHFALAFLVEHRPKFLYRPFKNSKEFIKTWEVKYPQSKERPSFICPHIWVRPKMEVDGEKVDGVMVTCFSESYVCVDTQQVNFKTFLDSFEFLDGTPCGIKN